MDNGNQLSNLPPLPPGFVLDSATANTGQGNQLPPLPEGFVLDETPAAPTPQRAAPTAANLFGRPQQSQPEQQEHRLPENVRDLPELQSSGLLSGESTARTAAIAPALLTTTDPNEIAQIITSNFPNVVVTYNKDNEGNVFPLLHNRENNATTIINKPGISLFDAMQFIGIGAAYTPAGKVGLGGLTAANLGKTALAAGATEGVLQASQAAVGGEFNEGEVALSAVLGPAAQYGLTKAAQGAKSLIPKRSTTWLAENGFKSTDDFAKSVGAAQTSAQNKNIASSMNTPIPFEGDAALTKGQANRHSGSFDFLQFEKEKAKIPDIGAPLRQRVSRQTETLLRNFDAIADTPNPIRSELRDIGGAVDEALVKRAEVLKKRVNQLYKQARDNGELEGVIKLDSVPDMLADIDRFSGVAPNAKAIIREAKRLGVVDDNLNPQLVSLEDAELFRQFVNAATDLTSPREARIRRIALGAIDDSTAGRGGESYQLARKQRELMAREFENVGITKRLLSTKGKTDERAIAFEDVFKKIILDSPIEEINKLRGTLLKSGADGKQAWSDLKGKTVEYIKEHASSISQTDEFGQPLVSADKLSKVIKSLDDKGKLQSLFGKKQAQVIRDLGDLAKVIYTAPLGAVNHSNTASALATTMETLVTFGTTGIPAPALTTLQQALKYVKNVKLRSQIKEHLNYVEKLNKRK